MILFAPSLWETLHRQGVFSLPPTSELVSTLSPTTSLLEGVGNHCAAYAATRFVHYTPPPFVAFIVHCFFSAVKSFLKIHLNQASRKSGQISLRSDMRVDDGCENYVNMFSSQVCKKSLLIPTLLSYSFCIRSSSAPGNASTAIGL